MYIESRKFKNVPNQKLGKLRLIQEARKLGNSETRKLGNSEARKLGNSEARKLGSSETRKLGSPFSAIVHNRYNTFILKKIGIFNYINRRNICLNVPSLITFSGPLLVSNFRLLFSFPEKRD